MCPASDTVTAMFFRFELAQDEVGQVVDGVAHQPFELVVVERGQALRQMRFACRQLRLALDLVEQRVELRVGEGDPTRLQLEPRCGPAVAGWSRRAARRWLSRRSARYQRDAPRRSPPAPAAAASATVMATVAMHALRMSPVSSTVAGSTRSRRRILGWCGRRRCMATRSPLRGRCDPLRTASARRRAAANHSKVSSLTLGPGHYDAKACSAASTTSASPSGRRRRARPLRAGLRDDLVHRETSPSRASTPCCSTSARTSRAARAARPRHAGREVPAKKGRASITSPTR